MGPKLGITVDEIELRTLTLDSDAYGEGLTDRVFAQFLQREAWQQARGLADGVNTSLRVRLVLQGDDGSGSKKYTVST